MLTIILGSKDEKKYLSHYKYVSYNDGLFDDMYKAEWFSDRFIQEILRTIDQIDIEKSNGVSFVSRRTGNMHSHKELSTGTKTLILMYKLPNVVFQARFGDNCTDFVERLAVENDIVIKADYFHSFSFKYVNEINYINYGIVARNTQDLQKLYVQYIVDNKLETKLIADKDESKKMMKDKHPALFRKLVALEERTRDGNNTNNKKI